MRPFFPHVVAIQGYRLKRKHNCVVNCEGGGAREGGQGGGM